MQQHSCCYSSTVAVAAFGMLSRPDGPGCGAAGAADASSSTSRRANVRYPVWPRVSATGFASHLCACPGSAASAHPIHALSMAQCVDKRRRKQSALPAAPPVRVRPPLQSQTPTPLNVWHQAFQRRLCRACLQALCACPGSAASVHLLCRT